MGPAATDHTNDDHDHGHDAGQGGEGIDLGIPGLVECKRVGSGGFATVYSALEVDAGRRVAVKVLHALDDAGRRSFERERLTMGQTTAHDSIVTMYRSGYTTANVPFLVMENMTGGSLQDRLRTEGPLSLAEAVEVVVSAAEGLGFAHGAGIVHKDIKPANILISPTGVAKLSDFGIASIRHATGVSQFGYTLAYTAPETFQAQRHADGRTNDPRDERSDLYSLAATLHALVVGHPPHVAGSDAELLHRILTEAHSPTGHPALDDFLNRALANNPDQRPRTATAFITAARALLDTPTPNTIRATPATDAGSPSVSTRPAPLPTTVTTPTPATEPTPSPAATLHRDHTSAARRRRRWRQPGPLIAVTLTALVAGATAIVINSNDDRGPQAEAASPTTATTERPDTAAELNAKGMTHYRAGQYDQAIEDFNLAVQQDPDNATILYNRGRTYAAQDQHYRAVLDFDEAIEADPTDAAVYYERATSQLAVGRAEEAIADLDQVIELDPDDADAYTARGLALAGLDQYVRADLSYDRAIELDPENSVAYAGRAAAHVWLGQLDRALADGGRAIGLDPGNAEAFYSRGLANHQLGRYDQAVADYERAIQLTDTGRASIPLVDVESVRRVREDLAG